MKILFVSPEAVPFAKTGGLADAAGALPKALKEIGHDIRAFIPGYKKIIGSQLPVATNVYQEKVPGSEVVFYFYEHERYFGSREGLYQTKGVDYADNLERFAAFCRAALLFVKEINWRPDVIHCNDWQSALAIAYLRLLYKDDPFFRRTAAVYTIHNIGYMGLFTREKMPLTGLGPEQFTSDKLEFWGKIALTKAGMVYADAINTVSPTYTKEIQTPEFGCGLDGLMRSRAADLHGIINGIDYTIWNPTTDHNLSRRYSPGTITLKSKNKIELQKRNNLPQGAEIPVIAMITRLADQKGFDILAGALDLIFRQGCQFILLGVGEQKYHDLMLRFMKKYPDQVSAHLKFDGMLAELIYAGADMFLMPSHYEPCGLGQLISFKYGTIPIVRKTGGLADTVREFDPKTGAGEGFVFEEYTSRALYEAVKRAVDLFRTSAHWTALQKKVMQLDYSWDASAKKYVSLYMKALDKVIR